MDTKKPLDNENGTIIMVVLLILLLLTLQGITSMNSSTTEVKISGNEKRNLREFYVADSGWREGLDWLNGQAFAPQQVNRGIENDSEVVRNFGDISVHTKGEEDLLPVGSEDNTIDGIPYWYKITEERSTKVAGSGPDNLKFTYRVESAAQAEGRQKIEAFATKIYKVGYN